MPGTQIRASIACLSFIITAQAAFAADWPQWRGPNRDGRSEETGLIRNWNAQRPTLEWMVEGMGRGYASLSAVGGRLYTTGNFKDGQGVVAIDAASGSVVWRRPVTEAVPQHQREGARGTPTIDGDRLYVVTSDGEIVCLKTQDGSILWKRDFRGDWQGRMMSGWGFSESPLVDGDRVLCTPGGPAATIVALNKMTGDEIWRSAPPAPPGNDPAPAGGRRRRGGGSGAAAYSSIVISNGAGVKQYVQLIGSGVIGVRAEDGKFLWNYNRVANGTANIPTPIVTGDYVFTSTGYQTGAALLKLSPDGDGVKAEEVYFLDAGTFQNHHGQMILVDGYVYAGHQHNKGLPICIELATGKVMWGGRIQGAGSGSAAITYADGQIIFRYQDGTVALVEATPAEYRLNGTLHPEYQEDTSWSHPVVVDGKLYLREQDKLMCYNLRDT
jgi:outer membrane protein assembly factor BamB